MTTKRQMRKMTTAEIRELKAYAMRQELDASKPPNRDLAAMAKYRKLQARCRAVLKSRAAAGDPDTGVVQPILPE